MKKALLKIQIEYVLPLVMLILLQPSLIAQAPTHYPAQDGPVNLTFLNILIYFVFPVVLVLLFLFWRRWSRNRKREEEQERKTASQ